MPGATMSGHASTDKSVGFVIFFGLLAAAGAVLVYAAPSQPLSAVGFSAAVVFGSVMIVLQHYYA
jgi:hypothetical protein